MVSTLGYALMCLLAKGSTTGYDLVRRIRRPVSYYWTAQQSQVYPELARLGSAGLVSYRADAGPGPRQRKTYTLTPFGWRALVDWLGQAPTPARPRNELLLKTYAVAFGDPARMRDMYAEQAEAHTRLRDLHRADLAELTASGASDPAHPDFGNYANVRLGVAFEESYVDWCRWLAEAMTARMHA